jgi:hypothetical protein
MSFGKSKASTTNLEATITNTDNRVGGDNAVFGGNLSVSPVNSSGDINVVQTDLGAIKGSLDFAGESLGFAQSIGAQSIKSANDIASRAITEQSALANSARQSETSGAINNFLKYGAIIAAIAIAAYAYKSR